MRTMEEVMGRFQAPTSLPGWYPVPAAEGADASGVVRVGVGPDGLPTSIEVDDDWTRWVRPEGIGRAVWQACEAARERQLWSWATEPFDETNSVLPVSEHTPDALPAATGRERSTDEVLAEAIAAFDELGDFANADPARGTGSAARGRLEIVLSPAGLEMCTADPGWASQRTGGDLTAAFAVALAEAREIWPRWAPVGWSVS
jgi:hypothetical protein